MTALTPQQHEVLRVAASGASNEEMASILGLSYETVKSHLRRIYRRLGVHSRHEAVLIAIDKGWIAMNAPVDAKPLNLRLHDSGALAVREKPATQYSNNVVWRVIQAGGSYYVTQRLKNHDVVTWQVLYSHNHRHAV